MRNEGQDRDEVMQRLTAIHQLHLGSRMETVAQEAGVHERTVYRWWEKWHEGGVKALSFRKARQGHSPKAEIIRLTQELSKAQAALDETRQALKAAQDELNRVRKEAREGRGRG